MSEARKIGLKLAGFPLFGPKRREKAKKKGGKEYRIRRGEPAASNKEFLMMK